MDAIKMKMKNPFFGLAKHEINDNAAAANIRMPIIIGMASMPSNNCIKV